MEKINIKAIIKKHIALEKESKTYYDLSYNIGLDIAKQSWDMAVDKCKNNIETTFSDLEQTEIIINENSIEVVKEMSKDYIK